MLTRYISKMHRITKSLVIGFSLITFISHAQTLTEQPRKTVVTAPVDLSEFLIEDARKSGTNFMADATHFKEESKENSVSSTSQTPKGMAQKDLTRLDNRPIVLLWARPEPSRVMELMKQGQAIKVLPISPVEVPATLDDNAEQNLSNPENKNTLEGKVLAYFRQNELWDEQTSKANGMIKVSNLPLELHDQVVAGIQSVLLRPESVISLNLWFSDQFWETAQLGISQETNGVKDGPKIPVLTVGGEFRARVKNGVIITGGTKMSLGALEKLPGE